MVTPLGQVISGALGDTLAGFSGKMYSGDTGDGEAGAVAPDTSASGSWGGTVGAAVLGKLRVQVSENGRNVRVLYRISGSTPSGPGASGVCSRSGSTPVGGYASGEAERPSMLDVDDVGTVFRLLF